MPSETGGHKRALKRLLKSESVIGVEKFAAVMVAVWDKCNLFHLSVVSHALAALKWQINDKWEQ